MTSNTELSRQNANKQGFILSTILISLIPTGVMILFQLFNPGPIGTAFVKSVGPNVIVMVLTPVFLFLVLIVLVRRHLSYKVWPFHAFCIFYLLCMLIYFMQAKGLIYSYLTIGLLLDLQSVPGGVDLKSLIREPEFSKKQAWMLILEYQLFLSTIFTMLAWDIRDYIVKLFALVFDLEDKINKLQPSANKTS